MLGEELWIVDRPRDVATAVQMALVLVYCELMARTFDRARSAR
jgi:hypothetical protein